MLCAEMLLCEVKTFFALNVGSRLQRQVMLMTYVHLCQ